MKIEGITGNESEELRMARMTQETIDASDQM